MLAWRDLRGISQSILTGPLGVFGVALSTAREMEALVFLAVRLVMVLSMEGAVSFDDVDVRSLDAFPALAFACPFTAGFGCAFPF